MKRKRRHFCIYSLAALAFIFILSFGCRKETLVEPEPELKAGVVENEGDRYLVGFTTTPDINAVRNAGGTVTRSFKIVPAVAARMNPKAVEALAKNPKVRYIEPDYEVYATEQSVPWGINRVFGTEEYLFPTWETSDGTGIGVAIIDTGIDEDHDDLPYIAGGMNFTDSPSWDDDNGHGTHVAGTVAAIDNDLGVVGVAPGVTLYAVKVLDASGSGSVSTVAAGIEWAANSDIQILNMSLGSSSESTTLHDVCDAAYNDYGCLIVSSAGNSGNPPGRGDNVGYPAAYESVIAVAASESDDRRAKYSSTGPAVELIAPGSNIYSTYINNRYYTASGTSMASPHVAGVAALTWASNNSLSNEEVRMILRNTAENLGLDENHQGNGLVRADLAVDAAAGSGGGTASVSVTPANIEGMADAGTDAVYTFTVTNTGDTEDTYDITVTSNWASAPDISNITLNAGASTTVDVTHSVPSTAEPGDSDTGTLDIASQGTGASASATFTTTAKGYAVEITPASQTGTGAPGESVDYVYTVSNTGTEYDEYTIVTTSAWSSSVNPTSAGINPGESQQVTVTHIIPGDASDGSNDEGTLTVSSVNANSSATFTTTAKIAGETSPPVIDSWSVSGDSNPVWRRVYVNWAVSDADGDLAAVESIMELNGTTVISSVSGGEATGTHELRHRSNESVTYQITTTVTDNEGNSDTSTGQIDF